MKIAEPVQTGDGFEIRPLFSLLAQLSVTST